MKNQIKSLMYHSEVGYNIFRFLLSLKRFYSLELFLSDKNRIQRQFRRAHGYDLNLEYPKTLNEKIQWFKLNERTPKHTLYADKFKVREIYEKKYGKDLVIPLIFHTSKWKDIKKENMPDYPFIIKPNHGFGSYHIIEDKNKVNWDKIRTDCRYWLSQNYYNFSREWQYKNIKPRRILIEKLLICKNGGIPTNFRVHCMHGRVEVIALSIYQSNDTVKYTNQKYSRNWELLNIDWAAKGTDLTKIRDESPLPKPASLAKMIEIAEDRAKEFKYVRVDFYDVDGQLYLGETTFHDGGGNEIISPFSWDEKLGALIRLND